ncbi:MAG: DUF6702 family protein [Gemmatimonadaceae bacterium]
MPLTAVWLAVFVSLGGNSPTPARTGVPRVTVVRRPAPAPHNTHISHARVVLEGPVVLARIRLFRDDLEKTLKQKVADDSSSHRVVADYIDRAFRVRADGQTLAAELLDSGADMEGDQPVWWVLVQWKAARNIGQLAMKAQQLFELFNDQQNLVTISRQPEGERRSLYFQAGDRAEQVVKF